MKKKIALISGITGQDGAYLAKLLLKKKYIVHGIKRRTSLINTHRIDDIYKDTHSKKLNFFLHYGDINDAANIFNLINKIKPDEIYNLAAQSHVKVSFDTPIYTSGTNALGTLNFLEAIKLLKIKKIKFYQASTSEMFGNINKKIIKENDRFNPVSPYGTSKLYSYWIVKNYRQSYNMFASNGILFNHESPLRGETFVSRKITMNVAKRFHGYKEKLFLGNIYAKRDWGHAEDYVEGMWKMLQYKKPDDFILASEETTTVKNFVNKAFSKININLSWRGNGINEVGYNKNDNEIYVKIDPKYFRPNELNYLKGDASKAKKLLKWKQKYNLDKLIEEMVAKDIEKIK